MLMVTNRGRNKILRDVDRTRLEVKNETELVPAVYSCAFPVTLPQELFQLRQK